MKGSRTMTGMQWLLRGLRHARWGLHMAPIRAERAARRSVPAEAAPPPAGEARILGASRPLSRDVAPRFRRGRGPCRISLAGVCAERPGRAARPHRSSDGLPRSVWGHHVDC